LISSFHLRILPERKRREKYFCTDQIKEWNKKKKKKKRNKHSEKKNIPKTPEKNQRESATCPRQTTNENTSA